MLVAEDNGEEEEGETTTMEEEAPPPPLKVNTVKISLNLVVSLVILKL